MGYNYYIYKMPIHKYEDLLKVKLDTIEDVKDLVMGTLDEIVDNSNLVFDFGKYLPDPLYDCLMNNSKPIPFKNKKLKKKANSGEYDFRVIECQGFLHQLQKALVEFLRDYYKVYSDYSDREDLNSDDVRLQLRAFKIHHSIFEGMSEREYKIYRGETWESYLGYVEAMRDYNVLDLSNNVLILLGW